MTLGTGVPDVSAEPLGCSKPLTGLVVIGIAAAGRVAAAWAVVPALIAVAGSAEVTVVFIGGVTLGALVVPVALAELKAPIEIVRLSAGS